MMDIKKIIYVSCFLNLFLVPFLSLSQSNRNAVIGRYIVTSQRLNGALVANQTCTTIGKLDLLPSNVYCNECIYESDSTDCNGSLGTSWQSSTCFPIKVFADSTMLDTAAFDPAYFATGKLYSNDSIYFRFKWCTLSEHEELTGFKLYSTGTKLDDLSLPGNALLFSPNPASDIMYMQSTQQNFINEPVLYDLKGAKVTTEINYVNSHTYKVDVSNLPNGIYFVFIQTNEGYLRKKVAVSK